MKTPIRTLAAALLAVLALPGIAHADSDDPRFDARALALSSESLLAEPALGSPEVAELVAGEVYQARSEVTPGANGWGFHELAVGDVTGYALEGTVAIIPAPDDPVSEDLTKRALVTSGGPLYAYPHPDAAPVAQVGTGDTVYTDPSNVVEVSRFLSTETLIPAETTDGTIGWLPENSVQVTGGRGGEDDVPEPAEEPAEDETSEPTNEDLAADEATDEPGDDSPTPSDEEVPETESTEEAFTVLGRDLTDPVLLGAAAGVLLTVALGWAALRRRGGGRGAPVTGAVVVEPAPEPPEPEIEELVYDAGEPEDDVEELVYDAAAPAHDADKDRFEF